MKHETDVFRPKHPYVGCHAGSLPNDHLASKDGERSIVLLDEFEKTGNEVSKTLLLPPDNGTYRDRRNGNQIDCRKTIWIFATNHTKGIIARFHKSLTEEQLQEQWKLLSSNKFTIEESTANVEEL